MFKNKLINRLLGVALFLGALWGGMLVVYLSDSFAIWFAAVITAFAGMVARVVLAVSGTLPYAE
jgi:hypothetical protein